MLLRRPEEDSKVVNRFSAEEQTFTLTTLLTNTDLTPSPRYVTRVQLVILPRIVATPEDLPTTLSSQLNRSNSLFSTATTTTNSTNEDSSGITVSFFGKRRKPRNQLSRHKSSFLSTPSSNSSTPTLTPSETARKSNYSIADTLNDYFSSEGQSYLFYHVGKTFLWGELSQSTQLSRLNFNKSFPTCHDVNKTTMTTKNLDVVIGFCTGDIIWFDPLAGKYIRINKQVSH